MSADDWIKFLAAPIEPSVRSLIDLDLQELEKKRDALDFSQISADQFLKLQVARTLLSHTLIRDEAALRNWRRGEELVQACIGERRAISIETLGELNQVLTSTATYGADDVFNGRDRAVGSASALSTPCEMKWRNAQVFTSGRGHPEPSMISPLVSALFLWLERNRSCQPIEISARVRQWIVSVHPFENGNGRTAQLAGDWTLLQAGFLPLSFRDRLNGMVIGMPGTKEFMTPTQALVKTIKSLQDSYEILLV